MEPVQVVTGLAKLKKALPISVMNALSRTVCDQIDRYRAENLYKILKNAEGRLVLKEGVVSLNPKIIVKITEFGSLEGDAEIQDMWAGLIASSTGNDSNLHFVEILENLTRFQARLLKHACLLAKIKIGDLGLIYSDEDVSISIKELEDLAGTSDVHTLDMAIDDLRRKGLIDGGFYTPSTDSQKVGIRVFSLALHFVSAVSGDTDHLTFYQAQITQDEESSIKDSSPILQE